MANKNKGILFILLASASFSMMSLFVKLAGDIPSIQKSFFRNLISLFVAIIVIKKMKNGFKFKKNNLPFLILRATFGTLGMVLNYYAISHLILADATMLNKLAPFFVIIFSFFILKERVKLWQIMAIIVAFIGSIFIINPSIIINMFTSTKVSTSILSTKALVGLLGAVFAGLAYTMVRLLSKRGESSPFIVFFFSAFSSIVTFPFVIFNYAHMELTQIIYLVLSGIFACCGQFSITNAYAYAPAKELSVFDYSQIIFSAILGYIVFNQMPDKYSFLGYFIILSMLIFMFYMNNKKIKK